MEYSIFDALRAGFTKVVFIIKPDMRDLMENMVGHHLAARCQFRLLEVLHSGRRQVIPLQRH